MLSMSLSRLMLYYTASLQLPYTIEYETFDDNVSETKRGNKRIRKEKQGLWEVETITIDD
ncbi:hypothetical protein R4L22_11145 [Brachyspira pilosicoli]|uniref:hypothetical protein n=1 Tax=Brachyspira pilosicoli TaxID=52584 RepID=UPI0012F50849|nr:hypothetical protein [Brachyspira pilosicoli]